MGQGVARRLRARPGRFRPPLDHHAARAGRPLLPRRGEAPAVPAQGPRRLLRPQRNGRCLCDAGRGCRRHDGGLLDVPETESAWRERLSRDEYRVLRKAGTERPFSGEYVKTSADGTYRCRACGNPLFDSAAKFDSRTGWPSFTQTVAPDAVELRTDRKLGIARTEVLCGRCDSHLGHVFDDGPPSAGGQRFCMNSVALDLAAR